jgi:transcriptional regulator with XRE-family HTH domain
MAIEASPRRRADRGVVAGFVLKLIREDLGLTQDEMAEQSGVERNTWQGWEAGRRPLINSKVTAVSGLRRRLRALGAGSEQIDALDVAMTADEVISYVLNEDPRAPLADHPLAHEVSTRDWVEMLGWALTGRAPQVFQQAASPARRGPVSTYPELSEEDRRRFFTQLRADADRLDGDGQPRSLLLCREIYYCVASWEPDSADWQSEFRRRHQPPARNAAWSPLWVTSRSLAVTRAQQGDGEPLREFIAHSLAGRDECETANLNYWAYWAGEFRRVETGDDFMATTDITSWRGVKLLRDLTRNLGKLPGYVDLCVHSLWALLERRPHLLGEDPHLAQQLADHAVRLLDGYGRADLAPQSRRELEQVHFMTRALTGRTTR